LFELIETELNVGKVLSTVNVEPLLGLLVIVLPAKSVPVDKLIVPKPLPVGTL